MLTGIKSKTYILAMLFLFSCGSEINTVDPQSSNTIGDSKKDGFFIAEYEPSNEVGKYFKIKDAWLENVWFNMIENNQHLKRKINEVQLSFDLSITDKSRFDSSKYLINWVLEGENRNAVGKSNGVFVYYLNDNHAPDTIKLSLILIDSARSSAHLDSFWLKRKR